MQCYVFVLKTLHVLVEKKHVFLGEKLNLCRQKSARSIGRLSSILFLKITCIGRKKAYCLGEKLNLYRQQSVKDFFTTSRFARLKTVHTKILQLFITSVSCNILP
jgi:hypothetical protein